MKKLVGTFVPKEGPADLIEAYLANGCFTGDCPHNKTGECLEEIINNNKWLEEAFTLLTKDGAGKFVLTLRVDDETESIVFDKKEDRDEALKDMMKDCPTLDWLKEDPIES